MNLTRLPGSTWLLWLHNLPLRVGVLTGFYLSAVFIGWLIAANRVPLLEDIALLRNAAAAVFFAVVMIVPVACFLRRPLYLFGSSITGWLFFSLVYHLMGFFFVNLHGRLRGSFQVFALGAIIYGTISVAAWVVTMALDARHQPAIASRRRHP